MREVIVGDPALESQLYSAITGKETGASELNRAGERIFIYRGPSFSARDGVAARATVYWTIISPSR